MTTLEIVEVESASQLRQFIRYPKRLYAGDGNYVPPLDAERKEFFHRDKNPFFKTASVKLFLALRNREVVGRIATCVNYAHNQFHEEQVGFFGFFDCPDDYEVASMLLKVAMITLKRAGMEKMRGPMNFSTNHECGFLVEGFDSPPAVMMTYNRSYLPKLAEKFGLKKVMDLHAYVLSADDPIPERIQNVVEKVAARSNVRLRSLRMSQFDEEILRIREVYNGAWQANWGFVPMDEDEFNYTARNLKQIVDPALVFIAEHDGRPVAFSLALPNINQALIHLNGRLFPLGLLKLFWHTRIRNKIDGLRLVTFGVVPEFQKRGIDSALYIATYKKGIERGYRWAELSWVLETNDLMLRAMEQMGARPYKKYRIAELPL
ncbi:MAG: GNAT family N-acetyltransferase [Candidatus Zixiibacteriota bacterium]|nr:MAG: GNAT family N-acetyltransferase [candidate division Zixibacteria bacterium]